ncbi:MAG TPA: amidohydrolase family protein [bacterium]|nr:amidohydrolase family protein [bacterium]
MIDIHTHIITLWGGRAGGRSMEVITEKELLKAMDARGVDRFVILPAGVSPEVPCFYTGPEDILKVYRKHPDRVIPFCDVDPRSGQNSPDTDFSWILNYYKEAGCKGLGEMTANLYFDDPKCMNLFRQAGKFGFPVLFHLYDRLGGSYGLADDKGLPRMERALKECPDTIFIGHAMAFWSEISADVPDKERGGYPAGKVKAPGRLQKLLKKYPNLYGDLSAGSGLNAITRDKEYGYKFLEEFQDKLMFGTDISSNRKVVPHIEYFREVKEGKKISMKAYNKIMEKNAIRVLKLK